jgi:hypothetical protein
MTKTIDESPRTTDTILFEIECPGADGCFAANPYKVDNLTVYYVERDFLGTNFGEYEQHVEDPATATLVEAAEKAVCDDPTAENLFRLEQLQNLLESKRVSNTFYYKDKTPVKIVGSEGYPAWLSSDTTNALLENIEEDEDGNTQYGHFTYEWHPEGSVREGDFFVCWTWTPNPAGESLSSHLPFKLAGNPRATITIPTHLTPEEKYATLLERYLPEMYKSVIANQDLTPQTTQKFNEAVADGFTFLENLTNQIIDLLDANALHESLLMYLSNLFNLKLKSSDPTLWRRQIKEAVPLFKRKGTRPGLEDAFAQAGMTLTKYTQFWQLTSPYTQQESFQYDGTTDVFELEKGTIVTPIDDDNFGLWVRYANDGTYDSTYTEMDKSDVTFEVGSDDFVLRMTWAGTELNEGDIIRVLYQYKEVPNASEQQLEDYIRALPLSDPRDEVDQDFPLKNWNVRLVTEEDPLFDVLVPVRHPYQDPLIFGFIRTEFPYGENIYNMEEYNGSTRPSNDVCHIGAEFIDPCGACLSSKYSVDVAVEELNNDRIAEAQDILREFMPFHAELHAINLAGEVVEFVQSPVEQIDFLVSIDRVENVLSGQANPLFHRFMEDGLYGNWTITRDELADKLTVSSGLLGTGYNDNISLVVVDDVLEDLGVIADNNILEVLAPSANAGTYTIHRIEGNMAQISSSVIEPVNESAFTFNLSNVVYRNTSTAITQDDFFYFSDSSVDFAELGVKTQWDTTNTPDYTGGSWKVSIPAYSGTPYEIINITNGVLSLDNDGTLPIAGASGVAYTLLTDLDATTATSVDGELEGERRGYVELNAPLMTDIEHFIRIGDYLHYGGTEYRITEFNGNDFWIAEWTGGDVAGITITTRRRLLRNSVGYFGYRGLKLTTFADHEAEFGIVNGSNPPAVVTDDNQFKENYMFKIGEDFFRITKWNGVNVELAGREQSWTTVTAGGTAVAYSLVHFPKEPINVQFVVFDHLDRDGHDVVIREIESTVDQNIAIVALSSGQESGIQENVAQEEGITFSIERRDGNIEEGEYDL